MTKISQYPEIATPDVDDLLVGTDVENSNATKNFTIQSIVDLVNAEVGITPTLQQVTIAGNTTNQPITSTSFIKTGGTSSQYLMADGTISVGGIGAQGPQGVQGPAGPPGPVGPAGLNWQGAWVSGTSYVADDAVGYGGASWFCILATSGTTNPSADAIHWALLASQGAQGIQGVQGPTGAQGASGGAGTLQQTVDNGNTITDNGFTATLTATNFKVNASSTSGMTLNGNQIIREKNAGSDLIILQFPSTFSGIELINLPNTSGTIALKTYNETVILLSYDGTNFTYTNVINELGVTITFSVLSGTLYCTLSSNVLTSGKTIVWAGSFVEFGGYLSAGNRASNNTVTISLTNTNGTNSTFPTSFTDLPVRIQVYN